jgi:hypothetical protein
MATPESPNTRIVEVLHVEGNLATVRDKHGVRKEIRVDVLRYKGDPPEPGEVWVLDRTLGHMTFSAIVGYSQRTSAQTKAALEAIDFSAVADPATKAALEALREALTG